MQKKTLIVGLSIVLTIMTAASALAGGWGMGFGGGMGGALGSNCRLGGGAQGRGLSRLDLDLSPEQAEKLLTIQQELTKDTLELRQQLQRLNLELRQLWAAEAPDQDAINQKLAAVTPLRLELNNEIQQAQKAIESTLTPEQLAKYKEFQPVTRGQGGRSRRGR